MANDVKHHRLSMSQWCALAECPHFKPSKESSPEANQGSEAHAEVVEIYNHIKAERWEPEEAFNLEMKYPQAAWCAYRYKRHQQLLDYDEEERKSLKAYCAIEQKLTIRDTDPIVDGIYGYADFVRIVRREPDSSLVNIMVADFKTFSDGTRNYDEQLAGYAVAVASTMPDATDETPVLLVTEHGATKRETSCNCTLGDCRRIAVDTVMKYLGRDRFPKVVNPKCRYCKNYPCEGAMELAKAVQPSFGSLRMTREDMDRNPSSIPLILASLEEVQKLIDATKENAKEYIKRHGVKGLTKDALPKWEIGTDDCKYEVRTSLGTRRIADVPSAVQVILRNAAEGKISQESLLEICSMPVGKLETLVRKALGLKPKEAAELLDGFNIISRGDSTETLKRIA